MKVKNLIPLTVLICSTSLYTCQLEPAPCTTEFRSVSLKVIGDSLTDFYTVRLLTSDTIRRSTGEESRTQFYLILDDSYQPALANKQEVFRFIGKIGRVVVVREEYSIEADNCHINKVNGKSEIRL